MSDLKFWCVLQNKEITSDKCLVSNSTQCKAKCPKAGKKYSLEELATSLKVPLPDLRLTVQILRETRDPAKLPKKLVHVLYKLSEREIRLTSIEGFATPPRPAAEATQYSTAELARSIGVTITEMESYRQRWEDGCLPESFNPGTINDRIKQYLQRYSIGLKNILPTPPKAEPPKLVINRPESMEPVDVALLLQDIPLDMLIQEINRRLPKAAIVLK